MAGLTVPPSIPVIALTAAETARLARLAAWTAGHLDRASLAFHLRWSKWRRRHQATARWHHYATRHGPGMAVPC
jgi:hypothetical protein